MSIKGKHLLMAALAMLPSLAAAQSPPVAAGIPAAPAARGAAPDMVTFVLVPSLEVDTAGAIVLRRKTQAPQNVILVSPATTPADLVVALTMLNRSRRSRGDAPTHDMKAIVHRGNDAAARRSRNYEQAVLNLERLRVAKPAAVAGVGTYPAVTVTLSTARPR